MKFAPFRWDELALGLKWAGLALLALLPFFVAAWLVTQ